MFRFGLLWRSLNNIRLCWQIFTSLKIKRRAQTHSGLTKYQLLDIIHMHIVTKWIKIWNIHSPGYITVMWVGLHSQPFKYNLIIILKAVALQHYRTVIIFILVYRSTLLRLLYFLLFTFPTFFIQYITVSIILHR